MIACTHRLEGRNTVRDLKPELWVCRYIVKTQTTPATRRVNTQTQFNERILLRIAFKF